MASSQLNHLAAQMREMTTPPSQRRQGIRSWEVGGDNSSFEVASTTTDSARGVMSGGSSNLGHNASTTTLTPYLGSEPYNLSNTMSQRPWVGGQPTASSTGRTRSNHKKESARSSEQKSFSRQDPQTRETDTEHANEADTDYVASWVEGYPDEAGGGVDHNHG